MKVIGLFAHPRQKPCDLRVSLQLLNVGKVAGKLSFGETSMDRAMANLMQLCGAEMGATF